MLRSLCTKYINLWYLQCYIWNGHVPPFFSTWNSLFMIALFNGFGEEILKDFYNSKDHNFKLIYSAFYCTLLCGTLFSFLEKDVKNGISWNFAIDFSKFITSTMRKFTFQNTSICSMAMFEWLVGKQLDAGERERERDVDDSMEASSQTKEVI